MRRRRFLAAVAASLSLAGCGSRGSVAGDDPGTSTPEGGGQTDAGSGTPRETVGGRATDLDDFMLGETTGDANPHELRVTNDGDGTRTVNLRITDPGTEETLLDRSYTLGGEEEARGTLRGPATYDVGVTVPEAETEHITTVDYFDTCNSYGTTVTIDPDGTISSETISTLIACEDPTVTPDESG